MKNIKMNIKYDGAKYKGWQKLKNEDMTIQSKIEKVLSLCLNENIEVIASGRTDAGVHAINQVANFKTSSNMKIEDILKYLYEYLPEDIVVFKLDEVEDRFHARYNVKSKTYLYKIYNNKTHDPFLRKYTTHIDKTLDINKMKEASKYLIGEHDFSSFKSSKSKKKNNIRTIYSIDISKQNNIINIMYKGNGFLHNMVRIITGTLIEVGMGNINQSDMNEILNKKCREVAGPTAKAQGLYLYDIEY